LALLPAIYRKVVPNLQTKKGGNTNVVGIRKKGCFNGWNVVKKKRLVEGTSANHKGCQEGAFTRNRVMPFNYLIVSIMKMEKSCLQREMGNFFKETGDAEFSIRRVTKSAFRQARMFLLPEEFLKLTGLDSSSINAIR